MCVPPVAAQPSLSGWHIHHDRAWAWVKEGELFPHGHGAIKTAGGVAASGLERAAPTAARRTPRGVVNTVFTAVQRPFFLMIHPLARRAVHACTLSLGHKEGMCVRERERKKAPAELREREKNCSPESTSGFEDAPAV